MDKEKHVKILNQGKIPMKPETCPECGTHFAYAKAWILSKTKMPYVLCPLCDERIDVPEWKRQ